MRRWRLEKNIMSLEALQHRTLQYPWVAPWKRCLVTSSGLQSMVIPKYRTVENFAGFHNLSPHPSVTFYSYKVCSMGRGKVKLWGTAGFHTFCYTYLFVPSTKRLNSPWGGFSPSCELWMPFSCLLKSDSLQIF